jgi:hypothetical protein
LLRPPDDPDIVVKENYLPDKTLGAITRMQRVKGKDAQAGDRFWAKYAANGQIDKAGKVAACSGGQSAKINNDWVFSGAVK